MGANIQPTAGTNFEKFTAQQLQAQENASHQVQSAMEQIYESLQIAQARKEAVEQVNEGYNRAQIRLDNGLGSTLELTEALLQVSELNCEQVFNYLSAKASYDLAIGRVPLID